MTHLPTCCCKDCRGWHIHRKDGMWCLRIGKRHMMAKRLRGIYGMWFQPKKYGMGKR